MTIVNIFLALCLFAIVLFVGYWLFWGAALLFLGALGSPKPEAPKPYVPLLKRIDRNAWIAIILFAAFIIAVNIADYIGRH